MHDSTIRVGAVRRPAAAVAAAGLVALAVAMGVGRFAFTPILPMMQADVGLTMAAAGWLAAANYLGYLVGALCAARLPQVWAIRGSLILIAVVTFAMGVTSDFALQLALRLAAGIGSAWVLIHISAWGLARLQALRRTDASGLIYAGVGVGIAGAGLVCMALMSAHIDSNRTWEIFGILSLVLTAAVWRVFDGGADAAAGAPARTHLRLHWNADRVRIALCYAAFGFGYIIPATFLSAMAHRYVTDPAVFGLAWPVFGAAAAVSTWLVASRLRGVDNRRLWAGAYVAMAIGVGLPVVWPGLPAILIAALLVGGTFMVATMTGLREARAVAPESATALIAALTAAFAFTQALGPVVVSSVIRYPDGFQMALLTASIVLLIAAIALRQPARAAR